MIIHYLNSILFGVLSVVTVSFIDPIIVKLMEKAATDFNIVICVVFGTIFIIDTIFTVYKVLQLSGRLKEINVLYQELKEKSEIYKDIVQQNIEKLDELIEHEKIAYTKELINRLKVKLEGVILKDKAVNNLSGKTKHNTKSREWQLEKR